MTFYANTVVNEGGRVKTDTTDHSSEMILSEILYQLKILNLHMTIITDLNIKKGDIDV